MNVGIVGMGLIGGSLAKAIQKNTAHTVLALDKDPDVRRRALESGAADEVIGEEGLSRCSLVVAALNPGQAVAFILNHLEKFRPGTVLMDVCGVKRPVCAALKEPLRKAGLHFAGAHPMAGREKGGFENSSAELFRGASLILDADADPVAAGMIRPLAESLGFAKTVFAAPETHDEIVAFTSQLAHVLSNAYVKSPAALRHAGFSAGSFQDLSRVAVLDEKMWSELFLQNRDNLIRELDLFIDNVTKYRDALLSSDAETLRALLKAGSDIKKALNAADQKRLDKKLFSCETE